MNRRGTTVTSSRSHLLVVGSIAFDDLDMPRASTATCSAGGDVLVARCVAPLAPAASGRGRRRRRLPEAHLDELRSARHRHRGVERAPGKTFRWHGRYSDDLASRTTLDTQLNVFADFSPEDPRGLPVEPLRAARQHPPEAPARRARAGRSGPRLVVADTMNFWIRGEPARSARCSRRIDLLVINDEEARQLSGDPQPRAARRRTSASAGPSTLIIKRGEYGALLFDEPASSSSPRYPLEDVLDPTGAGDTLRRRPRWATSRARGEVVAARAAQRDVLRVRARRSFCVEGIGPARLLAGHEARTSPRASRRSRSMVDYGGTLEVG